MPSYLKQSLPTSFSRTKSEVTEPTQGRGRPGGFSRFFGNERDFRVNFTPSMAQKIDIFLYGEIEDAAQFIEAIDALESANEGDLVIINLSTPGGSCDATDTFLQAMRECRARIIVKATGGVHSAGTVILLAAEEFVLSENFNSLIHNGSFGVYGKASDAKAQAAFVNKYMDDTARATYEGFLTDEEIEDMIAGKDFWMDAPEWMRRWNIREALAKQADGEGEEENFEEALDNLH
jgi:ATP-dependent protease ClpP protease subunit